MAARLDIAALADSLSAEDRERVLRAGVTLGWLYVAQDKGAHGHAFDAAEIEMHGLLADLVEDYAELAQPIAPPDLAAFGIRACKACGCTDQVGCADGCWWIADDLCSACAPAAEQAG